MLMVLTACSEFAILMSGSSLAISQNTYAKVYNSIDVLTIMSTEKSIKGHAYDSAKKTWTKVKEGKEYIYDNTINIFGNKH
jgi:pentose-5-phosphate-3-epimerase